MSFSVKCPGCQSTLQIPDSARGKQVRCTNCQQTLKIPAANPAAAAPKAAPNPAAPAATVNVKCPGCKSPLKLQTAMAGKVVRCSKCQTQLRVPGAPAAQPPTRPAAPASPAAPAQPAAPAHDPFANLPAGPATTQSGGFGSLPSAPMPAASTNPYAVPAQGAAPRQRRAARSPGSLPSGRSAALYNIPAILMALWATLVILGGGFQFVTLIVTLTSGNVDMARVDTPRLVGHIVGQLVAIALQIAVVAGSVSMLRRTSLGSARAAAIITAIPCFGCIIFPIGIWACVMLFKREAERDFA